MTEKDGLFVVYTDGACRGNPGCMGIGAVLHDPSGRMILEISARAGWGTNNIAEYLAVIGAEEAALKEGVRHLEVRTDSELIVRQLEGRYQVKNDGLKPLHRQALDLARGFEEITFVHIPREENREADRLANRALDLAERSADGGGTEEAAAT